MIFTINKFILKIFYHIMRLDHITHKPYCYHNKLQSQLAHKNRAMLLLVNLWGTSTNLVTK